MQKNNIIHPDKIYEPFGNRIYYDPDWDYRRAKYHLTVLASYLCFFLIIITVSIITDGALTLLRKFIKSTNTTTT